MARDQVLTFYVLRLIPDPWSLVVRCIWVIGLPGSNPKRGPIHARANLPVRPLTTRKSTMWYYMRPGGKLLLGYQLTTTRTG